MEKKTGEQLKGGKWEERGGNTKKRRNRMRRMNEKAEQERKRKGLWRNKE